MKKKSYLRVLIENLSYAYASQIVSTLVSICFTLLVPKVLGVEGYGYWQLIVFYATYLGVFYLGINDGIYLKCGGKTIDTLDKPSISGISKLFFCVQFALAILLSTLAILFIEDENRAFVLCMTAIFLPFLNIKGLYGHVLQAINNTKVYSMSLMLDKMVILAGVLIGLTFWITDFRYYVSFYVIGGVIATIYCCYQARHILKEKGKPIKENLSEIVDNIKVGLPLMLSSLAAMMITGTTRQIIDMKWEISDFSKISLALTMMNFVLMFLNQSSLVLFPAIRKIHSDSQVALYTVANKCLNIVLPMVFLFYVPVGTLVELWLPNYSESIRFLGVLLPICIFDGKMNLINNTYYKVLRMERSLFTVNVATFLLNLSISLVSAYVFENIDFMAYGLLISIVFRSILAELLLNRKLHKAFDRTMLIPIAASIVYIAFNVFLEKWLSFACYCAVCSVILLTMQRILKKNFCEIKAVFKKANRLIEEN